MGAALVKGKRLRSAWLSKSASSFRSLRPDDLGPKELPVVTEEEDEEEEEEMETVVVVEPEEKWDCETIISELETVLELWFTKM